MATICAMLSVDNIYFYPKRLRSDQRRAEEQQQQRDNANSERNVNLAQEMEKHEAVDAHMRLWKSEGDHFTLLNIYNKWTEAGPKITPPIFFSDRSQDAHRLGARLPSFDSLL
jgi:HrpA-like RNA helicase